MAWSCVGFCPDLHLATGILSYSRWQVCTRWLCLFYVKSTVGPPRPRFCSLYYSIKSYVRYWCTTACCRRVVLLLHTTPYEMLRLLLAAPLPAATTSASAQLLLLLLLLLLLSSVSSYITNQSRPATNSLLWDISGILPKQ